jgi:hypothetical protein
MKKLLLPLLLSLLSGFLSAQDFKTEEKTITGTFDAKEKTKSELYSSINKWISINYNSAKNVIQMNDLESGTIIVKGINEVHYKNTLKQLYPNNTLISEIATVMFNHLIEINIKDNKYRVIYKITNADSEGYDNLFFNCITLDTINDNAIQLYNLEMEKNLKKGLIGKEKREEFLSKTKPMFEEIIATLKDHIKTTMLSIDKSISTAKDNW